MKVVVTLVSNLSTIERGADYLMAFPHQDGVASLAYTILEITDNVFGRL